MKNKKNKAKIISGIGLLVILLVGFFGYQTLNRHLKNENMKKALVVAAKQYLEENGVEIPEDETVYISAELINKVGILKTSNFNSACLSNSGVKFIGNEATAELDCSEPALDSYIIGDVITAVTTKFPNKKTNGNVVVQVDVSEPVDPSKLVGWIATNNNTKFTKTFTENGSEVLTLVSLEDNTNTENYTVVVSNIDREKPELSIQYTTTETTSGDVTVIITANEELRPLEGWELSASKNSLSKTYSSNVTETIEVKDVAGNMSTIDVNISNIDKTAPVVGEKDITYTPTTPTNGSVTVTITANEPLQEVEGWTLSEDKLTLSKDFDENFDGTVVIKDLYGNKTEVAIKIDNIDKTPANVSASYSSDKPTKGPVVVTIHSDKELKELEGWTLSEDKMSMKKEYNKNTDEVVEVYDLYGNKAEVSVVIENIDLRKPEISYTLSPSTLTNGSVVVTFTSDEKMNQLLQEKKQQGWEFSEDGYSMTKTYYTNTPEKGERIVIYDEAGNFQAVWLKISNIDTEFNKPTVSYDIKEVTNGNVTVTITADEAMKALEGWTLSEDKKSMTKIYENNTTENVTVEDLVGNTQTVEVSVTNIDKTFNKPTVSYDIKVATNGNVTVTITADEAMKALEGWTLSEDKKSMTKTYENNTTENVTVEDLVGNTQTVEVSVTNIDKEFNKPTVSYDIKVATNGNVTVTITADEAMKALEGWTLSEDKQSMSKVYTANTNGVENITVEDLVGNTQTIEVSVTNIDKEFNKPTVSYDIKVATNGNVTVTITADEAMKALAGWTLSEDKQSMSKVYTANTNGVENITVEDLVGNTQTVEVSVTNIDKEFNKPTVSYDIKVATNGNVTVTITADEAMKALEGWTLSEDKKSMTKTYENNTTENVTVEDLVGNTQTVEVSVTNIDKTFNKPTVSYDIKVATNGNVTVTITADEAMKELAGWTLSEDKQSMSKVYTANTNGVENITVEDLVGNMQTVEVSVTNIDKTFNKPTVSYDIKVATNGNVTVTITADEAMKELAGWTLSEDKQSMSKVYTANTNGVENITVEDLVGNTQTVEVSVTNIDKEFNKPTVSYDIKVATNGNVTVTITADEAMKALEGWTLSEDKKSMTKTYENNTTENVTVEDLVGNTQTVEVSVTNIDKTFNKPTVSYDIKVATNGNVTVTITADEAMKELAGWTLSEDKQSMSKVYTANTNGVENITVEDLVGNTQTIEVSVTNIDKTFNKPTVSYDIKVATNGNVTVTITADEAMKALEGWTLSEDKQSMSKVYTANTNGVENITVEDLVGNTQTVEVSITNIDKTFNKPTVSYDIKVATNGNVTVTITADEAMKALEGWTLSEDKKSMSKVYTANTNGVENITVEDLVGNTQTVEVSITNIDKTFNKPTVSYDIKVATNGNVTVTITADEAMKALEGWTLSEDKKSMSKVYTANTDGEETVAVEDLVGNIQIVNIEINNIDKTFNKPTVSYDVKVLTNGNVTVTITADEAMKELEGWTLSEDKQSMTKTYENNTTENVTVEDLVGNTQTVEVSVTNIDKTFNKPTVSYDVKVLTNGNVTVTITADEAMKELAGWTLSEDKKSMRKVYTTNTNGVENITVEDLVGNTQTVEVSVTNIDKTFNKPTVSYDVKVLTNGNVTVTITADEAMKELEGWTLSEDKKSMSKVYTTNTNGVENITVEDLVGNTQTVEVSVTNIDKTFNKPTVSYDIKVATNGNVTVTITADEAMKALEGWTLSEDKKSMSKVYTTNTNGVENITVEDLVGNTQTVEVSVTNIDKTPANIKVTYSTTDLINKNVTVKLTSDKPLQELEGWTLSENKKVLTKVVTENETKTIVVKDLVGNETNVTYSVENIDKTFNKPVVSYSTKSLTNGVVIVTITADEVMRELEGWTLSEDKKSMTKSYNDNVEREVVYVYDLAGNKQAAVIKINNFDRTPAVVTPSYSPEGLTNKNVVITLTSDKKMQEKEGWTLSKDKMSMTKTVSENVTETIKLYDLAGNETSVTYSVGNIDKTFNTPVVSYSTKDATNGSVIVTITADEVMQEKEGWTLSEDKKFMTKEYSENVEREVVYVYDLAGNRKAAVIKINNIDKTPANIQVTYSTTDLINKNVVVKLTSDKPLQELEGWTLSTNKRVLTKTVSENETKTIVVKDLVGNETNVTYSVENIDKTFNAPVVSYSTKVITGGSVVVTITADEAMKELEGWTLSEDKKSMTKEYSENVEREVVYVYDLAGNKKAAVIKINNIDKVFNKPTVEYSITTSTNGNVLVTIKADEAMQEKEGWTLSKDKKSMTKTYENNATEVITVKDLIGNEQNVTIDIKNIDKTFNKPSVDYDIKVSTNGNVTVTITADEAMKELEGWTLSEDKQSMSKVYTTNTNGVENITVEDLVGNTQTVEVSVTNIDKTFNKPSVDYDIKVATNGNVTVTITADEKMQELEGWTLSEDKKSMSKVYTANTNGVETVTVKDLSGNEQTVEISISNIDKTFNKPSVDYDIKVATNGNVVVTITADKAMKEKEGWTLAEDKMSMTKTYENNATEIVTVEDLVGNTQNVTINIKNIDKEFNKPTVEYSTDEATMGSVLVTIKADEPMKEKEGWRLSEDKMSMTKIYNTSVTETIIVEDLVGNTQTVEIKVENIDNIFNKPTVEYSTSETTNGHVVVTIKADEEMQEKEGWTLSKDKMSMTKEYSENVEKEIVTVKDLAGNEQTVEINISNIDNKFNQPTVEYSTDQSTKGSILVTITADEPMKELEGWTLSEDKMSMTKSYENNVTEMVTVEDLVGNTQNVTISIKNIDKEFNKPVVEYSTTDLTKGSVLVTIKADEPMMELEGWTLSEDKMSMTKSYDESTTETITVKDLVGNTQTVEVKINNIDKTFNKPSVTYDIKVATNGNVLVTITADEAMKELEGWTLSRDKMSMTKSYENNTTERVTVEDLVGNTQTVEVKINNIDKTFNKPTVGYSITTITKEKVVVTITADEAMKEKEGWTLSEDKMSMTKTYEGNTTENVTVEDLVGNTQTVEVKINNIDKEAPSITLNGDSVIKVKYGTSYNDLGVIIRDNSCKGENNLCGEDEVTLTVEGKINTYSTQLQTITYKVVDKAGNVATKTRTVEVIPVETSLLFKEDNNCTGSEICYNKVKKNNYIWYSGYLWRVISIDGENRVKMIMEDTVAGFSYDDLSSKFEGSIVQEWLMNEFYPTLNNANQVIATAPYCNQSNELDSSTDMRTTCDASSIVRTKVGLLTLDEYNILGADRSFLNTGDQFFTMTITGSKYAGVVDYNGIVQLKKTVKNTWGIRPVITINSDIRIVSGTGAENDPYRLENDESAQKGDALSSRGSGEYVEFAGQRWRIIKKGAITRIMLDSLYTVDGDIQKPEYGAAGNFNLEDGIGYYLNTVLYNQLFNDTEKNMMAKISFYNNGYHPGANPRFTSLLANGNRVEAYVGLSSVGNILSGNSYSGRIKGVTSWLMNYNDTDQGAWYISSGGTTWYSSTTNIRGVKPVIALRSEVKIASGNGTFDNPYKLDYSAFAN